MQPLGPLRNPPLEMDPYAPGTPSPQGASPQGTSPSNAHRVGFAPSLLCCLALPCLALLYSGRGLPFTPTDLASIGAGDGYERRVDGCRGV